MYINTDCMNETNFNNSTIECALMLTFCFPLVTPYPKLELLYFGEPVDLENLEFYPKSIFYTAVFLFS